MLGLHARDGTMLDLGASSGNPAPPSITHSPSLILIFSNALQSICILVMSASPITCHVLDTTTGRPARNLDVTLTLLKPLGLSNPFTAQTDDDGRIRAWTNEPGPSMKDVVETMGQQGHGLMEWALTFDTGSYFGSGKTFFPEVEVRFFVTGGNQHYHVPLLLGPWSYTTYRGS